MSYILSAGKSKPSAASLTKRRNDDDSDSDVDGAPLRSDSHPTTPSSSSNATDKSKLPAGFVPSKWETIEPEEVQAQVGARHSCLSGLQCMRFELDSLRKLPKSYLNSRNDFSALIL